MSTQLSFDGISKVQTAVSRIQAFVPPEGYYLAFSGGKDSQVLYHLAELAGVPFDAHYNVTGLDPPELVYFIRKHYPKVIFEYPGITMWRLIPKKMMPPTRIVRYCCAELKERGGMGRFVMTGVRWAESVRRKQKRALVEVNGRSANLLMLNSDNDESRRLIESCTRKGKHVLNPIIDWTTSNVWDFLLERKIPYCSLYDEGFTRLGCIACPMGGEKQMKFELVRYPAYRQMYLRAFERMLANRAAHGLPVRLWSNAEEVMTWWVQRRGYSAKQIDGQMAFGEELW